MSAAWKPLLPLAMVGTGAQASLPTWPGEIGQLIAGLAAQSPDTATVALRASGVLASCGMAGANGEVWTAALPSIALDDVLPEVGGTLPNWIAWSFQEGPARLHHEICLVLASAACRLPSRLLPVALDLGRRSVALRAVLSPVLGERGRWLATMNEDWRYATGVSENESGEAVWSEGSIEQRRAFLARERANAPQAARLRLQQALPELSAKERTDLLLVLVDGLSMDDAALLESLRADRSREVRAAALALLLRLPGAEHPRRAMERMAALLKFERGLIRKRWVLEAPEAMGGDWKADNLDTPRPKNESLGERAWLLYQVARQVPLSWWTTHLDMSPQELHQWAKGTDWHEALIRAWRDVLMVAPDEAWCEAFLAHWSEAKLRDDPATILALLPRASRERHWQQQLRDASTSPLSVLVPQMLAACAMGETLSQPLSKAIASALMLRAASATLDQDHALRWHLADLACALHVDAIESLTHWPRQPDETPYFAVIVQTVVQIASTRQALHNLSTPETT